jgi:hypothetical protein
VSEWKSKKDIFLTGGRRVSRDLIFPSALSALSCSKFQSFILIFSAGKRTSLLWGCCAKIKCVCLGALAYKGHWRYGLAMTELLERAFTEASKLPEKEQDAVAALLLEELSSEKRWDAAFTSSPHQLSAMGKAALREFAAGETRLMDADRDFPHQ